MLYAWISQIRAVFARRSLAVLASLLCLAFLLRGADGALHLVPLALAFVAAMTLLDGSWRFVRSERRRRAGVLYR